MRIDYSKWLVVPFENAELLNKLKIVKEIKDAFEPVEDEIEIQVVNTERLSPEKVDENWKEKAEEYSRWWSEESAKVRKLEGELKLKKAGDALVGSMGESPL